WFAARQIIRLARVRGRSIPQSGRIGWNTSVRPAVNTSGAAGRCLAQYFERADPSPRSPVVQQTNRNVLHSWTTLPARKHKNALLRDAAQAGKRRKLPAGYLRHAVCFAYPFHTYRCSFVPRARKKYGLTS